MLLIHDGSDEVISYSWRVLVAGKSAASVLLPYSIPHAILSLLFLVCVIRFSL